MPNFCQLAITPINKILTTVDFQPKTFLILYPSLENSTNGIAVVKTEDGCGNLSLFLVCRNLLWLEKKNTKYWDCALCLPTVKKEIISQGVNWANWINWKTYFAEQHLKLHLKKMIMAIILFYKLIIAVYIFYRQPFCPIERTFYLERKNFSVLCYKETVRSCS